MTFAAPLPVVVLDASFAVEAIEGEERYRDRLGEWLDRQASVLVPAHFWAETANALLLGRRLPPTDVVLRLDRLSALGLETADRGLPGLSEAIDLADRHRLTVYDALYLQLALDIEAALATRDASLARAAVAEDLVVVD